MGEQRNINTGGGDAREVHNQGRYAEGNNIDDHREYQGITFDDRSSGTIGTVIQNFHPENPYKPGIPFQVPPVPGHFVPRPQYADRIREQLLSEDASQPGTLVVSAIQGLGGIGKSVLAAALAYEPAIRDRFPDGVLWVTLGQQPDLLPLLGEWIRALGDRDYQPTTKEAASSYLRSLLADKTILLVVDDLWNPEHFEPFRLAGKGCRVLVTTREVRLTEAQRCELGVLSLAESVQLVEQRLQHELADDERELFGEFARAVGYLPLALELAAVQIADGYDWRSLLEDLREEFDILDLNESTASDEVRRKFSLRACFNLSLKRLDADSLRRFAWLGVLPEDVSVDARMVATLWETKPVLARKGLNGFRDRCLLLSGVAVAVNGRQEPTFRQHDLLHDLARELLVKELGQSLTAAHGQLLDRYRPASGAWWDLADDGYIHRRLTWHMEQAGWIGQMHELIRSANGAGRNAWGEACEALGLLTVFVEDVARAWRCAEEVYGVIPTQAGGWRWQFWCAFAMGSMNSLVGNIPGELLATAVRQGHWSEARAVAYALQKRDEEMRSEALVKLMPELRGREIVEEAIQAARGMVSAGNRDRVFVAVITGQPEYWSHSEALEIARQISNESQRAMALSALAEKLPPELFGEALEIARQISSESSRAWALSALAEKQPELFSEALEVTRQISGESQRAMALIALAEKQPELFSEALEVTRQISFEEHRAMALRALVEKQPELLGEVLEVTRQISSEFSRAWALSALAEKQPELFGEVLEVTRQISDEFSRAWALRALAEKQPELFGEVLEVTRQISDESDRASALRALAEKQPELLGEVLEVTRQISDESDRASALGALAEKLPPELFGEVLEVTRQISDESDRAWALRALAEKQPELFDEALEVARQISDESDRACALRALAEKQPELFGEALKVTRQISNEYDRASALRALAEKQPELFDEALEITHQISNEYDRAMALSALAQKLPPDLLGEALEVTRQISDESDRAMALSALAERQPELFGEALEVTRQISSEFHRDIALRALAEKQPELFGEALEIIRQISDESCRAMALSALAEKQPELFGEALEVTRQISSEFHRAMALSALAEKLPTELFSEALEITRQISSEFHRAMALRALAEKQPELFGEALEVTRQISSEFHRATALSALAEKLPTELFSEARQTAIAIRDPYHRAEALTGFTDPTSWQTIATDQNQNLLRLLSTRERKHLIELLPKLHPTLLQLGNQPAVEAAIEAMRDACNQWP
jgi:hypothetical protein